MRAFVTGATGFLGSNLVHELAAEGWSIVAIHRPSSRTAHLRSRGVTLVAGDVVDERSLDLAMPNGVDVVFHVAGDTSLWSLARERQTRVNVTGTRNAIAAAIRKKARRFVHTSSIAAYGHHHGRISEETRSNASHSSTNYHRTKWLAEQEIRRGIESGLDAVMINPPHIVGRWDYGNWSRMIRLVAEKKLPGIPPGAASWSHAREVARAHIAASTKGRTGENYILGGADASYVEAVQIIGELTGQSVPSEPIPAWLLRSVAWGHQLMSYFTRREPDITPEGAAMVCESMLTDCSKAKRELDFRPVPLREMLAECHAWMVEEEIIRGRSSG